MRFVGFIFIILFLVFVFSTLIKDYVTEKYGVWRPLGSKENPYLEKHRYDSKLRHNHQLETADKVWAALAETDSKIADWWKAEREEFARKTRR